MGAIVRMSPSWQGGDRASAQEPTFKWVNTLLGNVKNALRGTFHAFELKYSARYLVEFKYSFNRRFDLGSMIERFSYAALRTPPMSYRLLKLLRFIRNQEIVYQAWSIICASPCPAVLLGFTP